MRDPKWLEADRRFQKTHPRRRYRLRPVSPGEFVPLEGHVAGGTLVERPDGTVDPVKVIQLRAKAAADEAAFLNQELPPWLEPAVLVVHHAPGTRTRLPVVAPVALVRGHAGDAELEQMFGDRARGYFEMIGLPEEWQ